MIGLFINLCVGMVLIIMGLVIWIKQKASLIHSYHVKGVNNIKGYTSAMGKNLALMGVFIALMGIVDISGIVTETVYTITYIIGMFIFLINFFRIQKKYSGRFI